MATPAPASRPAPKPPAPTPAPVMEAEDDTPAPAGPTVERISIGTLVIEKTVYSNGESDVTETSVITKGPDEKYKSWRGARSVD